jgi:hypothetical protein
MIPSFHPNAGRPTWNWTFFGTWALVFLLAHVAQRLGLMDAAMKLARSVFESWQPSWDSGSQIKEMAIGVVFTCLAWGGMHLLSALVFQLAGWRSSVWWLVWWVIGLLPLHFISNGLAMAREPVRSGDEMEWFALAVAYVPIGLVAGIGGWLALRKRYRAADLWLLGNGCVVVTAALAFWLSSGGTRVVVDVTLRSIAALISASFMTWIVSLGLNDPRQQDSSPDPEEAPRRMPVALKVLRILLVYLVPLRLIPILRGGVGAAQLPGLNDFIVFVYCACGVALSVFGIIAGLRLRKRPGSGVRDAKLFLLLTVVVACAAWALPFYGDLPRDPDIVARIYRVGGWEALGVSSVAVAWFWYLASSNAVKAWTGQGNTST